MMSPAEMFAAAKNGPNLMEQTAVMGAALGQMAADLAAIRMALTASPNPETDESLVLVATPTQNGFQVHQALRAKKLVVSANLTGQYGLITGGRTGTAIWFYLIANQPAVLDLGIKGFSLNAGQTVSIDITASANAVPLAYIVAENVGAS